MAGSYLQEMSQEMAEELEAMHARVTELIDEAYDLGLTAVAHKLEEASGPLSSAASAARQYDDGTLKVQP